MITSRIQHMQSQQKRWEKEKLLLNRKELTEKEINAIKKRATGHMCTYAWEQGFPKMRLCSRRIEILCDMALKQILKQGGFEWITK